jgi:hypothetical protein
MHNPHMQEVAVDFEELRVRCGQPDALNLYASLILGEEFRCPFPPVHEAYWALLVRAVLAKDWETLRFALGLPRGFAKTTLMKLFSTWLFAYTDLQFGLIVSATEGKAINVVDDISGMMDCENYRTLFGNWRHEVDTDSKQQKIFRFGGRWRILYALGAEGSVRGLNIKNRRPDFIVLEDAQDKECADSPVRNDAFLNWFLGTLYKARSYERALVVFIGNMYNEQCVLNKLRLSPLWTSLISGAITRTGHSIWPEFRSLSSLLDDLELDRSTGKEHLFLAEVMNDPLALQNNGFDTTLIKPYPYAVDEIPACSFIIVDPALGKSTSDDTVLGAAHVIDGKPVLRRIRAGKYDDIRTVDLGLQMALEERAPLIAVESVAYQATLCSAFRRTMQARGIVGIEIVETGPRGRSKNSRIADAGRKWLAQAIEVHPEARMEVIAQFQRWNPLRKDNVDDILDVLAYIDPVLAENWAYLYAHADALALPPDMRDAVEARTWGVNENAPF